MKSVSKIQQSDKLIETLNNISDEIKIREKENAELLAVFFDKYDQKTSKHIREKGLPKYMICGEKIYPVFNKNVSHLFKVISSNLIDDDQIILSWMDIPNGLTNSKYLHYEI